MRKLVLAVFVLAIMMAGIASAAIPTKMSIQGRLTNATSGALITSANLNFTVTSGGTVVYSAIHSNVVSNGMFYATIGDSPAISLDYNQDYNLSVYAEGSTTPIGGPYTFRGGQGQINTEDVADVYLLNNGDTASGTYTFSGSVLVSPLASCSKVYTDANGNLTCGSDITNVTAGNGLTDGGEGTSVTLNIGAGTGISVSADAVGIDTSVVPRINNAETITAMWTFPSIRVTENLFLQGNLTTYNVAELNINGSMTPFFSNQFNLGTPSLMWANGYFATGLYLAGYSVLAANTVAGGNLSGNFSNLYLAADSVSSGNVVDGSLTSSDLAANAITSGLIADGAVGVSDIADNAVNTSKIADGNITTAKLDDGAVTAAKIGTGAVETAKLADDAVTLAKLADNSVNTSKILDYNVTSSKIADSAVIASKIGTGAVETAKLADGAVTAAKIDSSIALWTNSSDNATYTAGNVGIGTTAPGATLTVLTSSGGAAAIGDSLCSATGTYAVAMGGSAVASNAQSIAMGYSSEASGQYSTAMGYDTTASGQESTSMGRYSKASSSNSFAWGGSACVAGAASCNNTQTGVFAVYGGLCVAEQDDVCYDVPDGAANFLKDVNVTEDLTVGGYMQIAVNTTNIDADCVSDAQLGRMIFDRDNSMLLICNGTTGWAYASVIDLG